jgi:AAA+ superfamily predicted ATPase
MENDDITDFGSECVEADPAKGSNSICSDLEPVAPCEKHEATQFRNCEQYSVLNNTSFKPTQKTINTLTSGLYNIKDCDSIGVYFERAINITDEIIEFPDSNLDEICQEIEVFWNSGGKFKFYNFLHTRGYMFHGPAGSGKTMLIKLLIQKIILRGGIVFICNNPSVLIEGLKLFREIEPERPIIVLFEDIDAIISNYGEDRILSYLDGEFKIDNCLNIATTNYPERLNPRVVNRPRRFDRVIKIGMPNANIRREYFIKKLKLTPEEVKPWVDISEGFSFAALADLVISVKCLDHTLEFAGKRLQQLNRVKEKPNSEEYYKDQNGNLGFGGG